MGKGFVQQVAMADAEWVAVLPKAAGTPAVPASAGAAPGKAVGTLAAHASAGIALLKAVGTPAVAPSAGPTLPKVVGVCAGHGAFCLLVAWEPVWFLTWQGS